MTANAGGGTRIQSVDLLRGFILFLVALDILRYFIFAGFTEPTNLTGTTAPLFFTRWITHFFVPGYLLLAGVGAYLKGQTTTKKELSFFLLTRGVLFILLEIFVVGFLWKFDINIFPILFQFVWVLGASMILLAGLIWLPLRVVLGISIAVLFGHNLLDEFTFGHGYLANIMDGLFHKTAIVCEDVCARGARESIYAYLSYPLIPWAFVMSLGFGLGQVFSMDKEKRQKILIYSGLVFLGLFLAVRFLNGYGSPDHWEVWDSPLWTLMSFLNPKKYPPSMAYLLMTLGPLMIALALMEKIKGKFLKFVAVFGRVPLFFYLVQFFLAHVLALILGLAQGYPVEEFLQPMWLFPEGYGVGLIWVYVAWIAQLALMYPFCEWYGEAKAHRKSKLLEYF